MILERFYTDEYDDKAVVINNDKTIVFSDLKKYVYMRKLEFEQHNKKTVVLLGDESFEFIVNFFAALFSNKEIYLLADKNRLNSLTVDYFLPQKNLNILSECRVYFEKIDIKETKINFFTSGSTAEPKTVVKTFENLENEAKAIIEQFKFDKDIEVLSTTIMPHMFGLTFHFMVPFYLLLPVNTKRIEFPEQIDRKLKYMLVSSPSFLEKMAKYEIDFTYPPKLIITAGDRLKDEVRTFFEKNSNVTEIYGSTETGVIAYKKDGNNNFRKFDRVNIMTDENRCIIVKSDFFREEKIKMEDIIEKLSDSEFGLKGRSDRIVKIKEKRVSLIELETDLKLHKGVIDAYCFKYFDTLACAVVTNDIELDDKCLRAHLLKYSEIVPKKWRFLDELPKHNTGKIDISKLNQIFGINLTYPFIKCRKVQHNSAEIDLIFRKNSNFFKGHFPIMPVLPGVVQLYYANWFSKDVFKIDFSKSEAKKIKFTNIIKAGQKVTLKLKNNDNNIEYSYIGDDKVYSSGIFVK